MTSGIRRLAAGPFVVCGFALLGVLTSCSPGVIGPPDGSGAPDASVGRDAGNGVDSGSSALDSGSVRPDGGSNGVDAGSTLASKYPCDKGIASDPAVVWSENFSEGSVSAFQARYDSVNDPSGETLLTDVPAGSCSPASVQLVSSGTGANATDFYKDLAGSSGGYDEWYVRWYAKYQGSVNWHHTGVWFGGYNPPLRYPYPRAGNLPAGNDLFSVAIEPIWGVGGPNPQFDTYNYWMNMHSYKANPTGNGDYYGNSVVNQTGFVDTDSTWICLEVHIKLNTDPASATGAAMDIWKNDALVQHYDEQAPLGFWTADKFCPTGANESYCVEYPAPDNMILDLQWRNTAALQLNYFWPQNYITDTNPGSVQFADMVVATTRVGCIH
jgi:hypothetical protein